MGSSLEHQVSVRWLSSAVLAALTIALTGCSGGEEEPTGETRSIDLAEQSGSGQSGTATLTPVGESTKVVIDLDNSPSEPQPAHIHTGTCDDLGGIEYPLEDVENGSSETTVPAPTIILLGAGDAAFAINVHKSASVLDTYVACGTLSAGFPPPAP